MTIDFYYDFGSPNAYLVHKVLPALASGAGTGVSYHPILLGGVFKATGNQSPFQAFAGVTGKIDYLRQEIARFIERHALPFAMNPHFPVNTLMLMRGAVFAEGKGWERLYIDTVFNAMWVGGEKMDDPETILRVLGEAGLPAQEIAAATQDPAIKQALIDQTQAAVDRGVFGAPTIFVGDEMFFGKDALVDLEWRLSSQD